MRTAEAEVSDFHPLGKFANVHRFDPSRR